MSNNPRTQLHQAANDLRGTANDAHELLERIHETTRDDGLADEALAMCERLANAADAMYAALRDEARRSTRSEWADEVEGAIG